MEETFNYSRGSIWRRLTAVHLMRDYPEVRGMLIARELNLTTVSVLHEVVYKEGGAELIPICRGKTQREVDIIIAEYRAKVAEANGVSRTDYKKEKVKVVPLRTGKSEKETEGTINLDLFAPRPDSNNSSGSSQTKEMTEHAATTTDVPESVDSKSIPKCAYRIEITADQELFDLLQMGSGNRPHCSFFVRRRKRRCQFATTVPGA